MKIEGHMSIIHRIWGRLEDAELLGAFSYQLHADAVARALIERECEGVSLVITDLTSGKMTVIHKPVAEAR